MEDPHNIDKKRRSIRFKNYDYSKSGAYFITICIDKMERLFGEIESAEIKLTELGKMAKEFWVAIPAHFDFIVLDQFVIMPNHIHGILIILKDDSVGVQYIEPQNKKLENLHEYQKTTPGSISTIVRSYKAALTRWAGGQNVYFKWQRNFYERVIRNEKELNNIQKYIFYNPLQWYNEKDNKRIENFYKS